MCIENIVKKLRESRLHESTEYEMDDEAKVSKIESDVEEALNIMETTENRDKYKEALASIENAEDELYDILDNSVDVEVVKRAKGLLKKISNIKESY